MTALELLAAFVNVTKAAIKSGDWKVDGACDPSPYLDIAEAMLEQEDMDGLLTKEK